MKLTRRAWLMAVGAAGLAAVLPKRATAATSNWVHTTAAGPSVQFSWTGWHYPPNRYCIEGYWRVWRSDQPYRPMAEIPAIVPGMRLHGRGQIERQFIMDAEAERAFNEVLAFWMEHYPGEISFKQVPAIQKFARQYMQDHIGGFHV